MKRHLSMMIVVIAVAAFAAPAVVAQCHHCCDRHRGAMGPGPMAGRGPAGGPMYDPDTVATLRGIVKDVEVAPSGRGRMGGTHVTLESAGKTTEVHIGPTWYVEREGVKFGKGQTIEVTGSLIASEKGDYLIARELKLGDKAVKLRDEQGVPLWAGGPRRGSGQSPRQP